MEILKKLGENFRNVLRTIGEPGKFFRYFDVLRKTNEQKK